MQCFFFLGGGGAFFVEVVEVLIAAFSGIVNTLTSITHINTIKVALYTIFTLPAFLRKMCLHSYCYWAPDKWEKLIILLRFRGQWCPWPPHGEMIIWQKAFHFRTTASQIICLLINVQYLFWLDDGPGFCSWKFLAPPMNEVNWRGWKAGEITASFSRKLKFLWETHYSTVCSISCFRDTWSMCVVLYCNKEVGKRKTTC